MTPLWGDVPAKPGHSALRAWPRAVHQTLHCLPGFIGAPAVQWNARPNSG